jgi:hypothetical protein
VRAAAVLLCLLCCVAPPCGCTCHGCTHHGAGGRPDGGVACC